MRTPFRLFTRIYAVIKIPTAPIAVVSSKHHKYQIHSVIADHCIPKICAIFFAVCEEKTLLEQEAHSQIRNVILGIFFLSLLFVGIGQTAVSTLGIPYIDDNVASKESAVYIGNTRAIKILYFIQII